MFLSTNSALTISYLVRAIKRDVCYYEGYDERCWCSYFELHVRTFIRAVSCSGLLISSACGNPRLPLLEGSPKKPYLTGNDSEVKDPSPGPQIRRDDRDD